MNDVAEGFRALTEDEKIENFEESTTSAILKQLGVRNGIVHKLKSEYSLRAGLAQRSVRWLYHQGYPVLPLPVGRPSYR
jgi:hypothetical protein